MPNKPRVFNLVGVINMRTSTGIIDYLSMYTD